MNVALTTFATAALLLAATPTLAKVTAVSTDGEATVYLTSDFSHAFDLDYRMTFAPAPRNASWSTVSILLLSGRGHGGSVSVGLSRGFPTAGTLAAFTTSAAPGERSRFRSFPIACTRTCRVELRGNRDRIVAIVNGKIVGAWARDTVGIRYPTVQINAEVAARRDTIAARVIPVRAVAGGAPVHPTCAFTTQGIEPIPLPHDGIAFGGTRRSDARVTYLSLLTARTGDSCPGS